MPMAHRFARVHADGRRFALPNHPEHGRAIIAASGSTGFTLLEVLVALAIAAPALILLFEQGASSVGAAKTSALYAEAISRAKSRLAALSDRSIHPGELSGEDGNAFQWHTTMVPLGTAPPPRGARPGTPYAQGATLYAITVAITWPGAGARSVTLVSRRIGPTGAGAP